jgi:hypothetical protein
MQLETEQGKQGARREESTENETCTDRSLAMSLRSNSLDGIERTHMSLDILQQRVIIASSVQKI